MSRAAAATVAALATLTVTACSGAAASVEVVPGAAVLDRSNATVTLPLDPYRFDDSKLLVVNRALDLILEECLADAGMPSPLPERPDAGPTEYRFFGPWVLDFVAEYGYSRIPVPETDRSWEQGLSAEQSAVIDECMRSDDWQSLNINDLMNLGASVRGDRESYESAKQNPLWQSTVEAYHSCMSDKGYTFRADEPFTPTAAMSAKGEQSVLIAVDDVECKDDVELIQTLTDVVAAYQNAFIADNEAALAEEQKQQQAILDKAELIIGRNS